MGSPTAPLDDLAAMRLTESEWDEVYDDLSSLDRSRPDPTRLSQIVFEAKVRQRFHAGRSSSTLAPTKSTSTLPWVGAACGILLLVVGGLLGGGAILAVVVVLSLGVMAVAVAGSKVAHRRTAVSAGADVAETVAMPSHVGDLIASVRSH